jgi:NADH-quinone oxidoreductase subunit N
MLTTQALEALQSNLGDSLLYFLPEIILCAGIVLLLVLRLFRSIDRWHLGWTTLLFTLAALGWSSFQWWTGSQSYQSVPEPMFSGLLAFDKFTIFLRLFLFGFAALVIWLTMLTGIPDREDSADFYCLLMGATVGMAIMASANHLLMVYLGVEMASLPSYALAGFLKGRRRSSEAALKYVVYGGGASGIMLYGISLLAGKFGTAYLPDLASAFVTVLKYGSSGAAQLGYDPVLLLGVLFVLVGIGFKLASVPFHFWCPDVFEGAPAEVAGFLSVASKGAALALLGRFSLMLAGLAGFTDIPSWARAATYLGLAIATLAAVTATFGNLAAYAQTNLKRLLAYSTIAHAGYMMMALASLSREGASAMLFYLVAYLFMNLGAFAVVAFLRNQTGSEDLSSYRGLIFRSPWMAITLSIFLLSLLGMPPLAGFAAKFRVFAVLYDSGQLYLAQGQQVLGNTMYVLLVIGGLNTVLSLVYYVRVMKVMILDRPLEDVEARPIPALPEAPGSVIYVMTLALVIGVLIIFWNPLQGASDQGVQSFHRPTEAVVTIERGKAPPPSKRLAAPRLQAPAPPRPVQPRGTRVD